MATQDKLGNWKGKLGPYTFRVLGDLNVIQRRPGKGNVKVSAVTKTYNREFCLASNRARMIRQLLRPLFAGFNDGGMANRLNRQLLKVMKSNQTLPMGERDVYDGDLSLLDQFDFNSRAPFASAFQPQLEILGGAGDLSLEIPAFQPALELAFPPGAVACRLKLLLSALDLEQCRYQQLDTREVVFERGDSPTTPMRWLWTPALPPNTLVLLTASLKFLTPGLGELMEMNAPELNPVALLRVCRATEPLLSLPEENNGYWGTWFPLTGLNGNTLKS